MVLLPSSSGLLWRTLAVSQYVRDIQSNQDQEAR